MDLRAVCDDLTVVHSIVHSFICWCLVSDEQFQGKGRGRGRKAFIPGSNHILSYSPSKLVQGRFPEIKPRDHPYAYGNKSR